MNSHFTLLCDYISLPNPWWLISGVFFLSQDTDMPGSKFVKKKCCNSSKKRISTISNTEWRVKLRVFFTILLGDSCEIRGFFYWVPKDIKRIQSSFWKHHKNLLLLYCLIYLLYDRHIFMFPLHLSVYIFHCTRSRLMARPFPVLKSPEKPIIPFASYTYGLMSYILWP